MDAFGEYVMLPLKSRLQQYATLHKAKWETIEQDYILSWILAGISLVPELRDNLVFKGGTCLRKCYFGDYRFSQDIDLSVSGNHDLLSVDLEKYIEQACSLIESHLHAQGEGIYIKSQKYTEKEPHPAGQQAFLIEAKLPWHSQFYTKVYVEVTFDEVLLLPSVKTKIIHPYGDNFDYQLEVYDINEIVVEKMRALLQFAKKLHERGWGRSRVRDYYDLWRIFGTYGANLRKSIIPQLFSLKCSFKDVECNHISELFQEKLMLNVEKEWDVWLKDIVVGELPKHVVVINELRQIMEQIFLKDI